MNPLRAGLIAAAVVLYLPETGRAQSPEGTITVNAVALPNPSTAKALGSYVMAKGNITKVEVRLYKVEQNGNLTLIDTDLTPKVTADPMVAGAGSYSSKVFNTTAGVNYRFIASAYGQNGAGAVELFDERTTTFVGQ